MEALKSFFTYKVYNYKKYYISFEIEQLNNNKKRILAELCETFGKNKIDLRLKGIFKNYFDSEKENYYLKKITLKLFREITKEEKKEIKNTCETN